MMLLVLGLHQPLLRFPGRPFYVYRVFASRQTWKMAEEDSVMCIPTIFTPDMRRGGAGHSIRPLPPCVLWP